MLKFFRLQNLFFDKIIIIPFLLLPFFLISGPFLPDFFISLSAILFLLYCFKNKDFKYFNNYFFLFFFIIYIYMNINSFFSFSPLISFQTSIPYIRIIIFSLCFAFILSKKNFLKLFFFSFYLSFIFLFIDSLIQLTTGFNIIGTPAQDRISSFFEEELIVGSFISRTLPFLLGIIFILDIKYKKYISLILLLISGSLVFISGERLAFAYYVITVFFFLIFFFDTKYKFYFFSLIIILFTLITSNNSGFFNRLFFHTLGQLKEGKTMFSTSYRHELHYLTALKMFQDKKILGQGLRSFRYLCADSRFTVQDKINLDYAKTSPIEGVYNIEKMFDVIDIVNKIKIIKEYYHITISSKNSQVSFDINDSYIKFYKYPGEHIKKGEVIFSAYGYANGCNTHPHNIYLQILSEIGLIGFILFFSFFLFLFVLLKNIYLRFKKKEKLLTDKPNFFFILGLILTLFPLFPSGSFYNNWLLVIFSTNLGFLINYYPLNIKRND
jgi:O-antigen ligase